MSIQDTKQSDPNQNWPNPSANGDTRRFASNIYIYHCQSCLTSHFQWL